MSPITSYTPEEGEFDRVFQTDSLEFTVDQNLIAPHAGMEDDVAALAQLLNRIQRYTDWRTLTALLDDITSTLRARQQ